MINQLWWWWCWSGWEIFMRLLKRFGLTWLGFIWEWGPKTANKDDVHFSKLSFFFFPFFGLLSSPIALPWEVGNQKLFLRGCEVLEGKGKGRERVQIPCTWYHSCPNACWFAINWVLKLLNIICVFPKPENNVKLGFLLTST